MCLISIKDYLKKIKESVVVFNTPAVLKCHGWKLAEYLALGKVIISTPISRELPDSLIDYKHLLLTDGSEEDIEKKVIEIISNPELAKELSSQSKEYFDNHLLDTISTSNERYFSFPLLNMEEMPASATDLSLFTTFESAYYQMIWELSAYQIKAIKIATEYTAFSPISK